MRTFKKDFEVFVLGIPKYFSNYFKDFGHTGLVTLDIETGGSPPISQKPYDLSLKQTHWVKEELEILEKAGIIVQSVSPWASPIMVVHK